VGQTSDIRWITTGGSDEAMQTFAGGRADAFLAFAAQPVELRTRKIGGVILDTTHDRPWSQYFCCMLSARREFVEKYPVATRRVLRAVLKAADLCAQEPERAARYLAAKGYEARTDIALEVLKRSTVSALARCRSRGHAAFSCAASARGRFDQEHAAKAPGARHRLALLSGT
jgi:ABC-type nitrate/sulfonate/bicarbonate transport system substrate-binding protein